MCLTWLSVEAGNGSKLCATSQSLKNMRGQGYQHHSPQFLRICKKSVKILDNMSIQLFQARWVYGADQSNPPGTDDLLFTGYSTDVRIAVLTQKHVLQNEGLVSK